MENKYYWVDIESGIRFECSKEFRDSMLSMWEEAKPKLTDKSFGIVMLTGTGGEINKNDSNELFYGK